MEKNSTLYKKCQGRVTFRGSRFALTGAYAPMYAACNGIRQSIIAYRENAPRVLGTKGGSAKKWVNLTLTLNCAEMVRPAT